MAAQSLECLQTFLSDDVRELDNNMVSQGTWGYVCAHKRVWCLGVCMSPDICICLCSGLWQIQCLHFQLRTHCWQLLNLQGTRERKWWYRMSSGLRRQSGDRRQGNLRVVYINTLRKRCLYKEHGVLMKIWGNTKASQMAYWPLALSPSEGHFPRQFKLTLIKCVCTISIELKGWWHFQGQGWVWVTLYPSPQQSLAQVRCSGNVGCGREASCYLEYA